MSNGNGKRMIGIAGVLALGLATIAVAQRRTENPGDPPHQGNMAAMEQCAKACNDCQRSCDLCSAHCGQMLLQGHKDHHITMTTCQDCATHCSAAAQIVARHGPFADVICKACAEACNRCAKACEKAGTDAMMKQCAEECRQCEKACMEMMKHTG